MDLKRVLIITYYWPPSGGSGVQRWLKFSKYLPENGWKPVILTPENPDFELIDNGLLQDVPSEAEVLQIPIWEPFGLYRKVFGGEAKGVQGGGLSSHKLSLAKRLSIWVRGNCFIPDTRMLWINPASWFLINYIKDNPDIKTIVSTGPPHSMHMVALKVKKKLPQIKWVADFRDPWTNLDFYRELMLSKWADSRHRKLENTVLQTADEVVCVGKVWADELEELGAKKCHVITNGYDEDDIPKEHVELADKYSIAHIGTLGWARNPQKLWEYLSDRVRADRAFADQLEIKLIGHVDDRVLEQLVQLGLRPFLNHLKYLPHSEAIVEQRRAHVLLLLINNSPNSNGILTGKVFEYLASQRPILCVGPKDSEINRLLMKLGCGKIYDYDERPDLDTFHREVSVTSDDEIRRYSRRALTKDMARLFD